MKKQRTYYYKCLYDGPNCVTGIMEKSWTGRAALMAEKEPEFGTVKNEFIAKYPKAVNIRNIKRI